MMGWSASVALSFITCTNFWKQYVIADLKAAPLKFHHPSSVYPMRNNLSRISLLVIVFLVRSSLCFSILRPLSLADVGEYSALLSRSGIPKVSKVCRHHRLYSTSCNNDSLNEDENDIKDLYTPEVTGGCVRNIANHVRLLDKSLERSSQRGIFQRINDIRTDTVSNITTAEGLDQNSRFGILSHGTQSDPIFNYANVASLILFDEKIEELCSTPSRYSTVPELMDDRSMLISDIENIGYGYIDNAVRITAKGKLFIIKKILVWNIYDDNEIRIGLAAMYDRLSVVPYSTE